MSVDTVRRGLASEPSPKPSGSTGLVPLAKPAPREVERALAHAGLLAGAAPVICEGESLPLAGALLVLPGLAVTGLLDAVRLVYGVPRAAFYSLWSFAVLRDSLRASNSCILPVLRRHVTGLRVHQSSFSSRDVPWARWL